MMTKWIIILLVLSITIGLLEARSNPQQVNKRCTKEDDRKVHTVCFYDESSLTLWCDDSNFTSMPERKMIKGRRTYKQSETLHINDSCVNRIEKGDFSHFPHLNCVNCAKNKLREIDFTHFQLKNLQRLDLSQNELKRFHPFADDSGRNLKYLDLSDNYIEEVSHNLLNNMPQLVELNLDENMLKILPDYAFKHVTQLQSLSIVGNNISHIQSDCFYGLISLEVLRLDGNDITTFEQQTFSHLPSLKVLSISYNKLTSFPVFPQQNKLQTINLGHNNIARITASVVFNMSHLQNLSLHNNSLKAVKREVLNHNENLVYLNFNGNQLSSIDEDAFANLCNLEYMLIKGNRIDTPNSEWYKYVVRNSNGTDQEEIVKHNQWRCDCDILQFYDFYANLNSSTWKEKLRIQCSNKGFSNDILDESTIHKIKKTLKCSEKPKIDAVVTTTKSTTTGLLTTMIMATKSNCTELMEKVPFDITSQYQPKPPKPELLEHSAEALVTTEQMNIDTSGNTFYILVIVYYCIVVCVGVTVTYKWHKNKQAQKDKKEKLEEEEYITPSGRSVLSNKTDETILLSDSSQESIQPNDDMSTSSRASPDGQENIHHDAQRTIPKVVKSA